MDDKIEAIFSNLPRKYKYAAMDADGNWYGYIQEPNIRHDPYNDWFDWIYMRIGTIEGTEKLDWKISLIKRADLQTHNERK